MRGCFQGFKAVIGRCGAGFPVLAALFALFWAGAPGTARADCVNPPRSIGQIIYNGDFGVFQGCTAGGWVVFNNPTTSPVCDVVGRVAAGGVCVTTGPSAMIVAETNEGTKRFAPNLAFDGATDLNNGTANTNALFAAGSDREAAWLCATSTRGGFTDWYLPAKNELHAIHLARVTMGLSFGGALYWSSTENTNPLATQPWAQLLDGGAQSQQSRNQVLAVRCVRRI